jgi:nicotinamide mononucleotide transporter
VILLGWFFGDIGLPGQQWLNWGFFLCIQLWAWPYWIWGGAQRDTLPVTLLSLGERMFWFCAIILGTWVIYTAIDNFAPRSQYPVLDALVVASSVIAQFLLGRKKVESWLLWFGPVNVVSIVLFALSGAYTLTALYMAFLIHAGFAIRSWYTTHI